MSDIVTFAPVRALDRNGDQSPGATAEFFQSGTSTPVTVYSDLGMTSPHPSPIYADSRGVFPPVYHAGVTLKAVVKDADGVTLPGYPLDPVAVTPSNGSNAAQVTFDPVPSVPGTNVQAAIEAVQGNVAAVQAIEIAGGGYIQGGGSLATSHTLTLTTAAVGRLDALGAVTANRLLGKGTGAGEFEELTLTTGLEFDGTNVRAKSADQSTWNTGTSDVEGAISPEKLAATIDHQRPDVVAIAEQTPTANTTFTFVHGLAAIPRHFAAYLRCESDSDGFVANQVIGLAPWQDSTTNGAGLWADGTNVYVRVGLIAVHGPSGYVVPTLSNFRIFVRVWP